MKKTDFILLFLVLVVVVVGIFSTKGTKAEEAIEFPLTLTGEVGLNEISYSDYKKMVDNGDAFVVVIQRDDCYYCQQYMPMLREYADKNKVAITYIDINALTSEEYNELDSKNSYLRKNKWGTPTTLFMVGSKVIDSIPGYVSEDSVDAFLKDRVKMGV